MHPHNINAIKIIITIIVSFLSPKPTAELTIKVVRNVKNNEAPFKIPVN
jgi:hypothetical protein